MRWSPWELLVSDRLREKLRGTLFGEMRPPRHAPEGLAEDGRTHALRALRAYIQEITFRLPDPGERAREYRFGRDQILIEWPDNQDELLFPRIEFGAGPGEYLPLGTVPTVFEPVWGDSRHVRQALVCAHEYQERLPVEVWATTRAQRRAIAAGLEQWLAAPLEETPGVRFRLPDYYGETCRFELLERQNNDGPDAALHRRRVTLTLEMSFNVVRPANFQRLRPTATVTTVEASAQLPTLRP